MPERNKLGNGIAVRIPRSIAEEYDIHAGKHCILVKEKEGIKLTPIA